MMKDSDLLMVAIEAALVAGEKILDVYSQPDFDVRIKSDDSPLTDADLKSHHVIEEYLRQTAIPILSEEGKELSYDERKAWQSLWIVDPLDGTKEFVNRNGEFTVNIALVREGVPVLGVVYAPYLRQLYYGSDEGAFFADLGGEDVRINKEDVLSSKVALPGSLPKTYTVVASKSHFSEATREFVNQLETKVGEVSFVSVGSSLKLCMVAAGKAHLYPRLGPTMEWDTAAGQAVLNAAGGALVDMGTKHEMVYNRKNLLNNSFVAIAKGVDRQSYLSF
jgi:3'(2'), 5'-bisphosphate nucleotidase